MKKLLPIPKLPELRTLTGTSATAYDRVLSSRHAWLDAAARMVGFW